MCLILSVKHLHPISLYYLNFTNAYNNRDQNLKQDAEVILSYLGKFMGY